MINKSVAESKGKISTPLIINDHVSTDKESSSKKRPGLVGIKAHTSSYVDDEEVQSPFRLKK